MGAGEITIRLPAFGDRALMEVLTISRNIVLVICMLGAIPFTCLAENQHSAGRKIIAVNLLPSLLSADIELEKKLSTDNRLEIRVIYVEDAQAGFQLSSSLGMIKQINGFAVRLTTEPLAQSLDTEREAPAVYFIAERLPNITPLLRVAKSRGRMLYSPYSGDVERGITAGISLTDRILPYVNRQSLKDARVKLKPFFLKVANQYVD